MTMRRQVTDIRAAEVREIVKQLEGRTAVEVGQAHDLTADQVRRVFVQHREAEIRKELARARREFAVERFANGPEAER